MERGWIQSDVFGDAYFSTDIKGHLKKRKEDALPTGVQVYFVDITPKTNCLMMI